MKYTDIEIWETQFGTELHLGTMVKIAPTCKYYEPQYDQNTEYMITSLYVDAGGLNIGLNEEGDINDWSCVNDGYGITDLIPTNKSDNK